MRNCFLPGKKLISHFLCSQTSCGLIGALSDHIINIVKKDTEMYSLIHWDNSKVQMLLWWIQHKYCLFFPFNNHGRHLELWPGVRLLYFKKPLSTFPFLYCWGSEWLGFCGTWAVSSVPVGGGPSSKNPVPDTLSCTQHCPVTSQGGGVRALCSAWKAVKRCKDCWEWNKWRARYAWCGSSAGCSLQLMAAFVSKSFSLLTVEPGWPRGTGSSNQIQSLLSWLGTIWVFCLFSSLPTNAPLMQTCNYKQATGLGIGEWRCKELAT